MQNWTRRLDNEIQNESVLCDNVSKKSNQVVSSTLVKMLYENPSFPCVNSTALRLTIGQPRLLQLRCFWWIICAIRFGVTVLFVFQLKKPPKSGVQIRFA